MARDLHPTNKSGFVRVMLPAIEDALRAGHTRKAVWQQLHEQNPALGYKRVLRIPRTTTQARPPTNLIQERGKSTDGYPHPGKPHEPAGVRSLGKPTAR
ncbi:MAG: hypothetical protein DMG98_11105 [Acidobacteria bacterium]|nr:MAG: hypothetical protein DMG98_11105 [Acidobacteriota bacterium]